MGIAKPGGSDPGGVGGPLSVMGITKPGGEEAYSGPVLKGSLAKGGGSIGTDPNVMSLAIG
jgi:hypothetical protein